MSLESRIKKIEGKVGEKSKDFAPFMLILYQDDNKEEILKRLKAKYGEDYEPRIIVISPISREEARRERGNTLFYKEIEEL
ncbi:MAG: hypothetical protein NC818_05720 [Candidatus Omnitrophica bacterium]|nr:hypothetical protein [Candidatus Omnitrophota bacterium]